MATGIPKTKWSGNGITSPVNNFSKNAPEISLSYPEKRTEHDILATKPAETKILWPETIKHDSENRFYYGDNLPILASLINDPAIRGEVRLVYIDPPFATKSVFQSRAQADAYSDLLAGAHYIEFIRERLILLRELLAEDGSIYVHLDENMAFHIKITGYPTEKNPNLLARIIQASSNPGDLVLDCFCGSGTTLAAASQLGRKWIGIDNSPEAISTTLRRFAKGVERMGDFVNSPKIPQEDVHIQQMLPLFNSDLKQDEALTSGVIRNFSFYTSKDYAGELEDIMHQWKKWQITD
jgi:16S rRNA G966 N2-methylase RsmD